MRLLIVVDLRSQLGLAKEFACRARDAGHAVAITSASDSPETAAEVDSACRIAELECLPYPESRLSDQPAGWFRKILLWLNLARHGIVFTRRGQFGLNFGALRIFHEQFVDANRRAEMMIAQAKPDVLIVFEDGISGPAPLIRAAKDARIRVGILPFGMMQRKDFENHLSDRYQNNELHALPPEPGASFFRRRASHWICPFFDKEVTLFPPEYIIGRQITGLDLDNPWTVHGGYADLLAVESPRADEIYDEELVPRNKRRVLGSPYCDHIADVLKSDTRNLNAFRSSARIDPRCTRILLSLPPSYGDIQVAEGESLSYQKYITRLHEKIEKFGKRITLTVSIHPNTLPEDKIHLGARSWNISENWIISEIPAHDIFISFFSSTIRWALAVGKPVINLDPYGWNLDLYDESAGFFKCSGLEELSNILSTLLDEPEYQEVARDMAAVRERWGKLDGKATNAILEACASLSRSSTHDARGCETGACS